MYLKQKVLWEYPHFGLLIRELHPSLILTQNRYVSCVLGCPFEGKVSPKAVADVSIGLYSSNEIIISVVLYR